jgi:hypothetical protein
LAGRRGLAFNATALAELGREGSATWLFRPGGEPSPAAWAYIAAGETANVHSAYKCRVRKPWWRVPLVPPADLLLTYMNADTPRLSTNAARPGTSTPSTGCTCGRRCASWARTC